MTTASIIWRTIFSLAIMAATAFSSVVINSYKTVLVGKAAVGQLEDSDLAWIKSSVALHYMTEPITLSFLTLLAIILIWISPIKAFFAGKKGEPKASDTDDKDVHFRDGYTAVAIILIGSLAMGGLTPAMAYYDAKDRPEYIEIQPNQSAFLIPLVGANKTSQKQFMSEAYLVENKVAAKRIQIPHTLINSGVLTERDVWRAWAAASSQTTSSYRCG